VIDESACIFIPNNSKHYLFPEHQYQRVSSFLLTTAILVYPYLQFKNCLCTSNKNQHATEDAVWRNRFPLNNINAC